MITNNIKGGSGICPHCKEFHSNVSLHAAWHCKKNPEVKSMKEFVDSVLTKEYISDNTGETMQEKYSMSNNELREAIEDTRLARTRTNEADLLFQLLTSHLEYLLKIQMVRASFLAIEEKRTGINITPPEVSEGTVQKGGVNLKPTTLPPPPPPPQMRLIKEGSDRPTLSSYGIDELETGVGKWMARKMGWIK